MIAERPKKSMCFDALSNDDACGYLPTLPPWYCNVSSVWTHLANPQNSCSIPPCSNWLTDDGTLNDTELKRFLKTHPVAPHEFRLLDAAIANGPIRHLSELTNVSCYTPSFKTPGEAHYVELRPPWSRNRRAKSQLYTDFPTHWVAGGGGGNMLLSTLSFSHNEESPALRPWQGDIFYWGARKEIARIGTPRWDIWGVSAPHPRRDGMPNVAGDNFEYEDGDEVQNRPIWAGGDEESFREHSYALAQFRRRNEDLTLSERCWFSYLQFEEAASLMISEPTYQGMMHVEAVTRAIQLSNDRVASSILQEWRALHRLFLCHRKNPELLRGHRPISSNPKCAPFETPG